MKNQKFPSDGHVSLFGKMMPIASAMEMKGSIHGF
jgi:hypothetical protein